MRGYHKDCCQALQYAQAKGDNKQLISRFIKSCSFNRNDYTKLLTCFLGIKIRNMVESNQNTLSARKVSTSINRWMTSFSFGHLSDPQAVWLAFGNSLPQSTFKKNTSVLYIQMAFHRLTILHFPSQENSTVVATVVCPRRF